MAEVCEKNQLPRTRLMQGGLETVVELVARANFATLNSPPSLRSSPVCASLAG